MITVIADSVYLVLNSWWDWKSKERLQQWSHVISLRSFQDEVSSTVLNALKAMDRGSRKTTKEGKVVIKA